MKRIEWNQLDASERASVLRRPSQVTAPETTAAVAEILDVVRSKGDAALHDLRRRQAANLSLLAYQKFGESSDRKAGIRLLNQLKNGYPSSSLVPKVAETLEAFETTESANLLPAALAELSL